MESQKSIFFYGEQKKNGFLSNFYQSPFNLDEKEWPTNEHYFQAQKFEQKFIQEKVRNCKTACIAKREGRKLKGLRSDWNTFRLEAMRKGIKAKFDQNSVIKTKLIETYPQLLVEHSHDKFWGDGHSDGLNWLGKLLVEVRDSYIQEENLNLVKKEHPPIKIKSPNLGRSENSEDEKEIDFEPQVIKNRKKNQ